jgi:thiamine pyrophosphokinase
MSAFVLFLHGRYAKTDLRFYRQVAKGKTKVAVDGGLEFFLRSGMKPDLIVGDFDSLTSDPLRKFPHTDVITYPVEKDTTDAQLAVAYAIKAGATSIDIVQPSFGEADHFTGNLMLLASLVEKRRARKLKLRLVNARYEIVFLSNDSWSVAGAQGDTVSVVPLSPSITLTCTGAAYLAEKLTVRRGDTIALRNRIISGTAKFTVKGQAFIFHQIRR